MHYPQHSYFAGPYRQPHQPYSYAPLPVMAIRPMPLQIPMQRPASQAPQALYVVGSFMLMMVLAAVLGVAGTLSFTIALDEDDDAPVPAQQTPAAFH